MKILAVILTGLGTTPVAGKSRRAVRRRQAAAPNPDCGMLSLAHKAIASQPGDEVNVVAHGWDEASADTTCRRIKDDILAFAPDKIIFFVHSFGGGLGIFFWQWLWTWYSGEGKDTPPFMCDLLLCFDPCPNGFQFGGGEVVDPFECYTHNERRWFVPETTVRNALVFFQQGGRPLGVKGVPLFERTNGSILNVDVTSWVDPVLAHVDEGGCVGIINDSRVQDQVCEAVAVALGRTA